MFENNDMTKIFEKRMPKKIFKNNNISEVI